MKKILKNSLQLLRIFGIQLKNNWVREAIYRSNFLTAMLVDFVWIAVEASLFTVIYAHVEVVGGWKLEQVYFFLGMFFASDALFTVLFSHNFWNFTNLVTKGELDILLTKPVNAVFLALTRSMNLTAVFNVVLGFIIMAKYGEVAGFKGGLHWFLVIFWLMIGLLSQLLLRFFFSVWVFWTDRGFSLQMVYYKLFTLATKPDGLYPKALRYLILSALPFALIGSVPARALMEQLSPAMYASITLSLVTFGTANVFLWKRGLLRYQSASS